MPPQAAAVDPEVPASTATVAGHSPAGAEAAAEPVVVGAKHRRDEPGAYRHKCQVLLVSLHARY